MKAAVLTEIAPIEHQPIRLLDRPEPSPALDELLLKVLACGLCRTELDEIEGRLPVPKLPRVLGHQVVGRVVHKGLGVRTVELGARVGVTWLWKSCGRCSFCTAGFENLCSGALWTGLDVDGGYAEYMTVPADFAHPLPACLDDLHTAPLLCAGVIGFRALRLAQIQDGQIVGLFGFGASAHLCIQILKARFPAGKVYVFTRSSGHRRLAEQLGADWTGLPDDNPPAKIDRAIDFTPIGRTVPLALSRLQKGGKLLINAIRKQTPIPPMDYAEHLWSERSIQSIANVTRVDAAEFLPIAAEINLQPQITVFPLQQVNQALLALKQSRISGAAVLVPST